MQNPLTTVLEIFTSISTVDEREVEIRSKTPPSKLAGMESHELHVYMWFQLIIFRFH